MGIATYQLKQTSESGTIRPVSGENGNVVGETDNRIEENRPRRDFNDSKIYRVILAPKPTDLEATSTPVQKFPRWSELRQASPQPGLQIRQSKPEPRNLLSSEQTGN